MAKRKVDERLALCLNENLHSPLTLQAAKRNGSRHCSEKLKMLEFLLQKTRKIRWKYGPIEVYFVVIRSGILFD